MKKHARIIKICKGCGKEFEIWYCMRNKRKFCSVACYRKTCKREGNPNWKGGKVERICETCGAAFLAKKKDVRKGFKRFCSRKCWGIYRTETFVDEKATNWQGGQIEVTCLQCEKVFLVDRKRLETAKFCSRSCMGNWKSENLRGENSHCWRGGYSRGDYPPEFSQDFKITIRERDDYTCAICGAAQAKDVHHIDYDKQNTTQENCITLCRKCHTGTNSNREYWIRFFSIIAGESKPIAQISFLETA